MFTLGNASVFFHGYRLSNKYCQLSKTTTETLSFLFSGLILRIPFWDQPTADEVFDDADFWEVPSEGVPDVEERQSEVNDTVEVKM